MAMRERDVTEDNSVDDDKKGILLYLVLTLQDCINLLAREGALQLLPLQHLSL
jgi:hypothetical protein